MRQDSGNIKLARHDHDSSVEQKKPVLERQVHKGWLKHIQRLVQTQILETILYPVRSFQKLRHARGRANGLLVCPRSRRENTFKMYTVDMLDVGQHCRARYPYYFRVTFFHFYDFVF